MALILKDRVRETTTSIGTGTIALAGPVTGYQSFSAAIGDGNTTYYTIADAYQWEVGIGTYNSSGNTLSRGTILASSAGGAVVSFTTGTKDVFVDYPAERAVYKDNGRVSVGGTTNYNPSSTGLFINGVNAGNNVQLGLGINNNQYSSIRSDAYGTTFTTNGLSSLTLGTNNTDRMGFSSNGATAIGYPLVANAQYALTIVSNTAQGTFNGLLINNSSYDTGITISGALTSGSPVGVFNTTAIGVEIGCNTALKSLVFKAGGTEKMRIDPSGRVGIGTATPLAYLAIAAGTASSGFAPLKFTSGTNLTTAEAGAVEYNGTTMFSTGTTASGRGVILAPQMVRLNVTRTKATNNTSLEAIFDPVNDTLALAANTLYYFRGVYLLQSAPSTGATLQTGFIFSNLQQDIGYKALAYVYTAAGTVQNSSYITDVVASTVTANTTGATSYCIEIEGWFKSNLTTGGTLIPAFTQSAAGTSVAPSALANSWFMIQPMSANPATTLLAGNWS